MDSLYLQAIYDREMDFKQYIHVLKVRFWEKGHSFEEIDNMTIEQMGWVLGYWNEKDRIERKRERTKRNLSKSRGRGK